MHLPRLIRFALVGGLVAALYIALYTAFLAVQMPQLPANALAFLLAVLVQYLGQSIFTFDAHWRDSAQGTRFALMIALGLTTSVIITSLIGPAFGWPATVAAIIVTLVLPVQNYLIMSRWVYTPRRDFEEKHP